jgi:hypothetical protein
MLLSNSMEFRQKNSAPVIWGLFLFLVMISIGYLTSNDISYLIVVSVRFVSIAGIALALLVLLKMRKIKWRQLISSALYFLLVLYGTTMSIWSGSFEIGQQNLLMNFAVIAVGLILVSMPTREIIPGSITKMYIRYVLLGLMITIYIGGLKLDFPPHFVFDYQTSLEAAEIVYSQGMSKFFGLGAIAAAFLISKSTKQYKRILLACITLILLALSFLGGARGDSVLAAFIVLTFFANKFPLKFLVFLLASMVVGYTFFSEIESLLGGFVVFQRLFSIFAESDFGLRDVLLNQVVTLLSQEPKCLVVGCGFGYFQSYYDYDFGMYPHNFIAESIIVFGLPITMIFLFSVIGGIKIYYRRVGYMDLFVLLFLYLAIINIKSGYLFGDWLFTVALMHFSVLYFLKFKYRNEQTSLTLNSSVST